MAAIGKILVDQFETITIKHFPAANIGVPRTEEDSAAVKAVLEPYEKYKEGYTRSSQSTKPPETKFLEFKCAGENTKFDLSDEEILLTLFMYFYEEPPLEISVVFPDIKDFINTDVSNSSCGLLPLKESECAKVYKTKQEMRFPTLYILQETLSMVMNGSPYTPINPVKPSIKEEVIKYEKAPRYIQVENSIAWMISHYFYRSYQLMRTGDIGMGNAIGFNFYNGGKDLIKQYLGDGEKFYGDVKTFEGSYSPQLKTMVMMIRLASISFTPMCLPLLYEQIRAFLFPLIMLAPNTYTVMPSLMPSGMNQTAMFNTEGTKMVVAYHNIYEDVKALTMGDDVLATKNLCSSYHKFGMQVTHGMGKDYEFLKLYYSSNSDELSREEGRVLAKLVIGNKGRTIGTLLSSILGAIYQSFGNPGLYDLLCKLFDQALEQYYCMDVEEQANELSAYIEANKKNKKYGVRLTTQICVPCYEHINGMVNLPSIKGRIKMRIAEQYRKKHGGWSLIGRNIYNSPL